MSSAFDHEILLGAPEFATCPYPTYKRLRSEAPASWSDARGAWVVVDYEGCRDILRDSKRFSNKNRFTTYLDQLPAEHREQLQPLYDHTTKGLNFSDPPEHKQLRSLFAPIIQAFSSRAVAEHRPRIQAIADDLLKGVRSGGRMDLIRDFAFPLPIIVISEILGFPPSDRDRVKSWTEDILSFLGSSTFSPEDLHAGSTALQEMRGWLRELIRDRRQTPQNDLLSALATLESEGQRPSDAELFSQTVSLVTAGHITTTNLIGNSMYALLLDPPKMRQLRENPALVEQAIEEFLRLDAPGQWVIRRVTEDVQFGGVMMAKDDLVQVMVGAANHDPAMFGNPDELNFDRQENRHLSFGGGIHLCIGRALARLEAQIAIATLLPDLPRLRLDPSFQPIRRSENVHRGLESLPVVFDV